MCERMGSQAWNYVLSSTVLIMSLLRPFLLVFTYQGLNRVQAPKEHAEQVGIDIIHFETKDAQEPPSP
jgi:hypothetical protein